MRPPAAEARRYRRKFLRIFPKGFRDDTYLAWEREYKALAHRQWTEHLDEAKFRAPIARKAVREIASLAVRIEARTNLLFSRRRVSRTTAAHARMHDLLVEHSGGGTEYARGLADSIGAHLSELEAALKHDLN